MQVAQSVMKRLLKSPKEGRGGFSAESFHSGSTEGRKKLRTKIEENSTFSSYLPKSKYKDSKESEKRGNESFIRLFKNSTSSMGGGEDAIEHKAVE